jgi:hypothetical protein
MLKEKLCFLNLPQLLISNNGRTVKNSDDWDIRRKEIIDILSENIYGKMPERPEKVTGRQVDYNPNAFAGKATQTKIMIGFQTPMGMFEFPVILLKPKNIKKPPLILHIAFLPADISNNYYPAEEITDNGFAVATCCYNDITAD